MLRKTRTRGFSVSDARISTAFDVPNWTHPNPVAKALPISGCTSTFHSFQLAVHINSTSVKMAPANFSQQSIPVFSEHDQVRGTVALDPSCSSYGTLGVSLEGTFAYDSNQTARKHTFYTALASFPVQPTPEMSPRPSIRGAFDVIRRRPSVPSSLGTGTSGEKRDRLFPFTFDLPQSSREGEELPHSCSSEAHGKFEISYKLVASWYPGDRSEYDCVLEVPILVQPDTEFQSLDGSPAEPETWLEMPLKCERRIPFQCAITLPNPVVFRRTSSIPYFVVFTTTPRSPTLAREIASDASVSVSLLRCTSISEHPQFPPSPPSTASSDEFDVPGYVRSNKVLRRMHSSKSPVLADHRRKPLARLPLQVIFTETVALNKYIGVGFPKRARLPTSPDQAHPPLKDHIALPDGLLKSKFNLQPDMLPSMDWQGVNVKYYIEVSVAFGQDELRARVPVRLT